MKIVFHPQFQRSYRRLDPQLQLRVDEKLAAFDRDPFDRSLHTHQLHGKLRNVWSFSVDARYRILFVFLGTGRKQVALIDVGTHRLYS